MDIILFSATMMDRWTDRQTPHNSIGRICIASCGKSITDVTRVDFKFERCRMFALELVAVAVAQKLLQLLLCFTTTHFIYLSQFTSHITHYNLLSMFLFNRSMYWGVTRPALCLRETFQDYFRMFFFTICRK